jgi:hypothetical protein
LRSLYRGFAEQAPQQATTAGRLSGRCTEGTECLINGIKLGHSLLLNGVRLELSGINSVLIKDVS